MSRSNPTGEKPQNPCTRFFEWNGEEGYFYYYDKEAKQKVEVKLPFAFLVLDQLSTIKGWSDADQSAIWSNEVKYLDKQKLAVFTKKGKQIEGIYEVIKGKVSGSKYTKAVYVAYYNAQKQLEIGCILMSGASLNAWIEFTGNHNVNKGAIRVESFTTGKKGKVEYRMPAFIGFDCKPETDAKATELDKVLQAYLTEYFAYSESYKPEQSKEEKDAIKASADHLEYARPKEESRGASRLEEESAPIVSSNSGLPADFDEF